MTVVTLLDAAHAALSADPENEALRLRFFERLADGEMFLLLTREAEGETIDPRIFPLESGPVVLVFDREERLAEFSGGVAPYAALPGRVIAAQLAGQGTNPHLLSSSGAAATAMTVSIVGIAPCPPPERCRPPTARAQETASPVTSGIAHAAQSDTEKCSEACQQAPGSGDVGAGTPRRMSPTATTTPSENGKCRYVNGLSRRVWCCCRQWPSSASSCSASTR